MPKTTIQFFSVLAMLLAMVAFVTGVMVVGGVAFGIWSSGVYLWMIDPESSGILMVTL